MTLYIYLFIQPAVTEYIHCAKHYVMFWGSTCSQPNEGDDEYVLVIKTKEVAAQFSNFALEIELQLTDQSKKHYNLGVGGSDK